ncbi:hypothetical protein ACQU0X_25740 [Pseudovibrio ascidiaceicola]|uniref:hypothetical protein n=1 Tax=Pseudovibrio ascidiaceicola TaxID=285279 RepID=UPI003D35B7A4
MGVCSSKAAEIADQYPQLSIDQRRDLCARIDALVAERAELHNNEVTTDLFRNVGVLVTIAGIWGSLFLMMLSA